MYDAVLFLHLAAVACAFWAIGVLGYALARLGVARSVEEARAAHRGTSAERWMPPIILVLLLTGAYMTQARWGWSVPWIDLAVTGLILIGIGGGFLGTRGRRIERWLAVAPDGALGAADYARSFDPVLWLGHFILPPTFRPAAGKTFA